MPVVMSVVMRLRWIFARRPMLWWILIVALASVAAGFALRALQHVDAERRSWGDTEQVWVAGSDIAPGELLEAVVREYPVAIVPAAALRSAPGSVAARRHLGVGEILVADDITAPGTAALLPAGSVAIAVPIRAAAHLPVGADVVAFANGARLATGTVVAVDDEQVVIAVPADEAPALTLALPGGTVIVGLLP